MWAWIALRSALAALIPDVVQTVWGKIKGGKGSAASTATAAGGADQSSAPASTGSTAAPKPLNPGDTPGAGAAILLLALAGALAVGGCGTFQPAFKASTTTELKALCDKYAPCDPCPGAPAEHPTGSTTPVEPTPTPQPAATGDAIPLSSITFDHLFNRSAKITATLSGVTVTLPQTVAWTWTHPAWVRWAGFRRDDAGICGTMWVIARIDGAWRAAGWEWLLPDTSRSTTEANPGEPPFVQTKAPPTNAWYPKAGEQVCWMVSTVTGSWDGPPESVQPPERSPIVCTTWPERKD